MKTRTSTISNPINDSLLRYASILISFVLMCVALLPGAQAVSPAPDGGYPGGNTAEGHALLHLTTGTFNTAVGFLSLSSDTEGQFNTAVGAGTLLASVGDPSSGTGVENTATGAGALLSNTTGFLNTATGAFALFSNTDGARNNAVGARAFASNVTGIFNNAVGSFSLSANTNGVSNNAFGDEALSSNTSGDHNTAIGDRALNLNTGDNNTACGNVALFNNTGSNNTALGNLAGSSLTFGDNNIDIGYNVFGVEGESNTIRIGNTDITDTFIGGISGTTVASGAAVLVDSSGHLGTVTSSKRFKEEVRPMNKASEAIFSLEPVTFRYKKGIDRQGIPQFGLVAEDVEAVNPELVVRDKEGKPYSVRYEAVNAMLLNEFLKEHRKNEEQEKRIDALTAQLKEQAAQIQKVSAQLAAASPSRGGLEASKFATGRTRRGGSAPQVVNNP